MRVLNNIILLIFLAPVVAQAQVIMDPAAEYPFINVDSNKLELNNSKKMKAFFQELDSLVLLGDRKINIFHLGDSHIQADFFSHRLRNRMQDIGYGQNGGRGFVFPYKMANTNNPWNYRVKYSGRWKNCRNVQRDTSCSLGMGGVAVFSRDSGASFTVWMRDKNRHEYLFDQVRVFQQLDTARWILVPADTSLNYSMQYNSDYGFTRYGFGELMDSISFILKKRDTLPVKDDYVLHGLSLDNEEPGIVYHSAGVNGAEVPSWLRCELLQKHLSAVNPQLVIISLGTNDAYMKRFNAQSFRYNYRLLLERLQAAAPTAAFLITAPGDNYRYRRYLNRNNADAVEVMEEIAQDQQLAFWNFYQVMGELNSVSTWYRAGLTARDRLHFNRRGYQLQGDLLFSAIMQAWGEFHLKKHAAALKEQAKN